MRVRTHQNETLDGVLWRYLGDGDYLAATLRLNPHLAAFHAVLPSGTWIELPETMSTPEPTHNTISLWD